ncbi:MAG: LysR family transcriptional regulator substrate-binding protein [Comamonadaceae bacterium]|nr:LysR family transcriptional regulator substrate-binding protein [Comamonadaceae bacterium]
MAGEVMACHDRIAREARDIGAAQQHHLAVALDPLAGCTAALAAAFDDWLEIYPNARLRIVAGSASELTRLVDSGEVSFAVAFLHDAAAPHVGLGSGQELGLLAARKHGLLGTASIAVREAAALPLILPPPDHPWRRAFEQAARRAGVQPRALAELASAELACAMLPSLRAAALASRAFALACRGRDALSFQPLASPRLRAELCVQFSGARGLRDSERMLIRLLRRALAAAPDPA